MGTERRCRWQPCEAVTGGSYYCPEHAERARRNVLRALSLGASKALLWREGDEAWLLPELLGEAS